MQNNVEILSPAGNMKAFIAAINAGADAIYMGVGKYNARAMAENFDLEQYIWCIEEAHKRDAKVYLTLNTLVKDDEIKEALNLVAQLYAKGLDAVILQDLGLAMKIHELFPSLSLHASTQMSVYSLEQVEFLKSLGFSRVVLARELSVEEIENICKSTDVEIEVFVHGALCVSVSGQCNMSRLIGERSANRGTCAQPCRMKYSLYKEGEKIPVVQNKYILSKKDIWGLDYIERLVNAGVKSLKIEGRNKFPEYVAMATKVYKKKLSIVSMGTGTNDNILNDEKSLFQIFNRSGKSDGYLSGVKFSDSITIDTPKNAGVKLGKVVDINKKYIKIKLENEINLHDGIEIMSSTGELSTIVTCIRDIGFNIINSKCNVGDIVWLGDINSKCNVGDVVYKTSDSKLNENLNRQYVAKITRQKSYDVEIKIKAASNVAVIVKGENVNINYSSDVIPEQSIKKSLTQDDVITAFSKTEDTSVKFENFAIDIDEGLFLKIADMNRIRREVVEKIETGYCVNIDVSNELEIIEGLQLENSNKSESKKINSLYVYSYNNNRDYKKEYSDKYNKQLERLYIVANDYALYYRDILDKYSDIELFFVIPNVTLNKLNKYIRENLEKLITWGVKGILVGNYGYMQLIKELKEKYDLIIGADFSLNICNSLTIKELNELGFDFVTLSFELQDNEVYKLTANNNNIELVENLATAMTSRYCLIGSFVGTKDKDVCNRACTLGKYYILDGFNKKYDIVCDNFDCIMRLVRNKNRYADNVRDVTSIRHVWL